jgi:hypothetical protein
MAMAASVSDLTADSIALLALLIACNAVVIVLADDVAWVAAVFSLDAAVVTLAAAADTARGVAVAGAERVAVVRLEAGRAAVARADAGRLSAVADPAVARLDALAAGFAAAFLAGVAAFAVLAFAAPGLPVSVGTDLSPRSGSDTGTLIPRPADFTHRCLRGTLSNQLSAVSLSVARFASSVIADRELLTP